MRQRYLHLSPERDGLVGIRGALLPDAAAKLQAIRPPAVGPPPSDKPNTNANDNDSSGLSGITRVVVA